MEAVVMHKQTIKELYRPIRVNFPRRRTEIRSLSECVQLDVADMSWLEKSNDGYRNFLLGVNPFSKKFYCVRLRGKAAREVCNATKKILDDTGLAIVSIYTDKGGEFLNSIFRREIENARNIRHFFSTGTKKVEKKSLCFWIFSCFINCDE